MAKPNKHRYKQKRLYIRTRAFLNQEHPRNSPNYINIHNVIYKTQYTDDGCLVKTGL